MVHTIGSVSKGFLSADSSRAGMQCFSCLLRWASPQHARIINSLYGWRLIISSRISAVPHTYFRISNRARDGTLLYLAGVNRERVSYGRSSIIYSHIYCIFGTHIYLYYVYRKLEIMRTWTEFKFSIWRPDEMWCSKFAPAMPASQPVRVIGRWTCADEKYIYIHLLLKRARVKWTAF